MHLPKWLEMPPELLRPGRAGAQNAIMLSQIPRQICERIGRIGYDEQHRFRRNGDDPRHNISIDFSVLVEEPKSSLRVAAIRSAAGFLVNPSRNHDQRRANIEDVELAKSEAKVPDEDIFR